MFDIDFEFNIEGDGFIIMVFMANKTGFSSMTKILDKFEIDETKQKRISREWQDYAYRLAIALDDVAHTAIYMRIVKSTPRELVERAKSFVMDAGARSKGKMFMWKLKQVKDEVAAKNKEKIGSSE